MNVSQERKALDLKAAVIIAIHGIVGWALCGSIVMIGREFWPMDTTLIIHAIGAPIIAGGLSLIYFSFFNYTSPLQTAAIFDLDPLGVDVHLHLPGGESDRKTKRYGRHNLVSILRCRPQNTTGDLGPVVFFYI
jgi:hypothetical protein